MLQLCVLQRMGFSCPPQQPCRAAAKPAAIRPPPPLQPNPQQQEYVRQRLLQFMTGLSMSLRSLSPGASLDLLDRAAADALQGLPQPDYGQLPIELMELQLVFRHDCQ